MFRSGIVLGLIFAVVGLVVFVKASTYGVPRQEGQMVEISFGLFALRFLAGMVLGAIIPLGVVIGTRLFVISHAMKQLSKQ